jgi:hypothetical protein
VNQAVDDLQGLNHLLHGATILGLELDPAGHAATLSLQITTAPKAGPLPVRGELRLDPVNALVVTVQTPDGQRPRRGMAPIRLDELNGLAAGYKHPLLGLDFIDSKRDAEPRGSLVFEWFEADRGSAHVLSFYYGVTSTEQEAGLLFFRIFFGSAVLTYPDGHQIAIDLFAPTGNGRWRAFEFGTDSSGPAPIKVLPDPVPPSTVDHDSLALLFIDSDAEQISTYAVGEARWDGRHLRWLSPDGVLYDLPSELAQEIRPRFPEMSMGGVRLDGFAYFLCFPKDPLEAANALDLVKTHLRVQRSWGRLLFPRK